MTYNVFSGTLNPTHSTSLHCVFHFGLDCFVLVLFAFVVLHLVTSVLCREIGWEGCLRNDLFCVKWDVKP